jgi:phosphoribosylpyrophosphate synthetase
MIDTGGTLAKAADLMMMEKGRVKHYFHTILSGAMKNENLNY